MISICQGEIAIFKGKPKQWRSYSLNGASYLIDLMTAARRWIHPFDTSCLPGPLLWFGTTQSGISQPGIANNIYGPCVFEFQFTAVLEAYQKCRGINSQQLCYRAAGTLVYQREVSHIVLVCSTGDESYQIFPLIQENNTKFFIPPDNQKASPAYMLINQYQPGWRGFHKDRTRHHHVIIAFHLPRRAQLVIPNQPYVSELHIMNHNYCVKSRGNCCFTVDNEIMENVKWEWYRKQSS